MIRAGDPAEARRVLRDRGYSADPHPLYFRILAEAEGRTGHTAEMRINLAEYYYRSGEDELAMRELQTAAELPDLSQYNRYRIEARIEEIRKLNEELREKRG